MLAANHVFLLEPSMDPAILQQAVGRAHRMGQTRPVHVTRLIMHSTVEVGWALPSPRTPTPPPPSLASPSWSLRCLSLQMFLLALHVVLCMCCSGGCYMSVIVCTQC